MSFFPIKDKPSLSTQHDFSIERIISIQTMFDPFLFVSLPCYDKTMVNKHVSTFMIYYIALIRHYLRSVVCIDNHVPFEIIRYIVIPLHDLILDQYFLLGKGTKK